MKTRTFSILFVVLVTLCLTAGTALASETTVFESLSHRSALTAPTLTVSTSGTKVSLSWTSVAGAAGYTLYYAPYPYTGPDSIGNIPMGTQTSISVSLSNGATFFVAVQAYNNVESSGYSNIEYFIIDTPATYTNSLGQTFVLLPAGTFTMGSPSDELGRGNDETQHQVTLTQSFYMQTTEVTQAQWQTVMGSNPSDLSGCLMCPVVSVSWDDVQSYITQMNLRGEGIYSLPTEAQWEYAARAGSTTAFANGGITGMGCEYDPNLDAIGWYCYNSDFETRAVGQKSSNAWGLYDMSGNVYELCQDWYGSYPLSAVTDPAGPLSGTMRVIRGGCGSYIAEYCRSSHRGNSPPRFPLWHPGLPPVEAALVALGTFTRLPFARAEVRRQRAKRCQCAKAVKEKRHRCGSNATIVFESWQNFG